jgi:hypothetical protein
MKIELTDDQREDLEAFQVNGGLSNTAMAGHLGVSPGVWSRAMEGQSVRISSYKKLVACLEPDVDDQMAAAHDMVNSPNHYADSEIECIDAMVAAFGTERVRAYCELAAFKYQWRCGKKPGNDADQEKAKSVWYLRYSMGDDPRKD